MHIHISRPTFPVVLAFGLLALAVPFNSSHSQEASAPHAIKSGQRDKVVAAVARYAEANYLQAERAGDIGRAIREQEKRGAYKSINDAEALVERLTADLQAVVPDKHLKVMFSAEPRPLREAAGEPSAEELERRRADASRRNFGIERAEHLDGNVGYLKLTQFVEPALAGETLASAMQFLSNTDALLIDLRFNGGGSGEMVAFLMSYFLESSVHIADMYDRPSDEHAQSWTLPYVPGGRYLDRPVFIVTGERTFSAAEGFTYALQKRGRASVVGQNTRGGAHFVTIFQIDEHFAVMVPIGTVTDAVTGSDWEGTGIVPDVLAGSDTAVRTAHRVALEKLLETADGRRAEHLKILVAEMKSETSAH